MTLGLGFKADVQRLRLIFSNGFGGWNQTVYKSKHFPFRANNLNSNETWASRHQLQVIFDIDVWKASPISILFMSHRVMLSFCTHVRKETSSLFKPRLGLAGQTLKAEVIPCGPVWRRQALAQAALQSSSHSCFGTETGARYHHFPLPPNIHQWLL